METSARLSWHVPAFAFFVAGSIVGCLFIGMAPFAAMRILGLIALLSGIAGASLMILSMQMENPAGWDMLRRQGRILFAKAYRKPAEWRKALPA
jgi:hypothetical protein